MNGEIRDREIRVISETGEMLGVMTPREAMRLAEEAGLDLVKISPNAVPPVCKIMDWGKFKFEQAKARKATEFLEDGNKVKVTIRLRGRQMAHAHLGRDVMMNFYEMLKDIAVIEKPVNQEGRNLIMILGPAKK